MKEMDRDDDCDYRGKITWQKKVVVNSELVWSFFLCLKGFHDEGSRGDRGSRTTIVDRSHWYHHNSVRKSRF